MTLYIKLFAVAVQKAGTTNLKVDCSTPTTVADLKQAVIAACPALSEITAHCRFAVDDEFATDTTIVTENSSLAIIPPVSGGA
ncbi:MAG: MoaD/ThiS family protein [Pirellulaceae bacterium]|jgi:molybdopterin converting factor subunit 1|nr:molybdopterin synthase sulfur carrier subunit [Planctomycetaceae bacterium]MDB4861677.1 MoaD/ThiS family protein [Pirellulaceae bacterium]|tara:strand:+ start:417 stop:665 length:249 start_codon:yes stop_codon:yes gene_type:complete